MPIYSRFKQKNNKYALMILTFFILYTLGAFAYLGIDFDRWAWGDIVIFKLLLFLGSVWIAQGIKTHQIGGTL